MRKCDFCDQPIYNDRRFCTRWCYQEFCRMQSIKVKYKCGNCNESLSGESFYKRKDGRPRSQCKECTKTNRPKKRQLCMRTYCLNFVPINNKFYCSAECKDKSKNEEKFKTCPKCGKSKTFSEFPKRKNGKPDSYCRECRTRGKHQ